MTDLSELLDSKMDERIMHAINDLDFDGFKSLVSELLSGIGVKVLKINVSEDAVFFDGVSEEGKYFVVASRLFDNASVESMKILKEMAVKRSAIPVLVVTCDLDEEEKRFAEVEGISYADKPKLLMLLRKYDLAGKMMAELDRRILEQDRNRYLPSGAQFDSFYNAAEQHLKQRRYRDALYNYDRALDIKPNNDVAWLRKANVFLAMGRFEDALVACKRASELRPGDATTWYLMGLAYNQLGDYEKELKAYDTALKIQPRMEAALLNKGATLFQLHRYDWALKVYEDMCNFFPKDAMAFNNRGIVLKALGRSKEALEAFDKASFLNQKYIDPVVNRALTLAGIGRNEEAIEAWTEALQIDRERADIWYSLGMSQKAAGRIEEATLSFENAALLDKGMTEAITERDELLAAAIMVTPTPEQSPAEAEKGPSESERRPEPEVVSPIVQQTAPEPATIAIEPTQAVNPEPEQVPVQQQTEPEIIEASEPEIMAEEVVPTTDNVQSEVVQSKIEAAEVPKEVDAPAPDLEPEINMDEAVPAEEAVQAELVPENPAIEAASLPAEEHDAEPAPESALGSVEPCSLIPTETELALLIREVPCTDIQKVEISRSVVAVETPCVPAIRDDECSVAVQGERELPAVQDQGPAVEEHPETTIDLPVAEAVPVITPAVPQEEAVPKIKEPVYEAPLEPEIPISDRELKAAVILNILGENDRALEEIDRYIKDKLESLDARHVKANILDDLGRLPECLEQLTEAIRLDPRDEIALMDIEAISRRVGRKDESMRILASIVPSKEVRAREAVGLLEAKRYDEIISKCSNLGPLDSLVSRMTLATALMAKAKYRDAYRVLKEILLEHPAYPEALNNMGVCMRFMGEYGYDEPMHFMHLAVEADPNYGDAWNNIGATLFVLGDYNAAMEAIRRAVAVDRRSDYLINLSKCQIMMGDIAGAKLSLTSALKYEETAEIDFALGLIAEKEGDMKWALKLYDSAIQLYPNFKDAIFNKQRVRLFLKYTQK